MPLVTTKQMLLDAPERVIMLLEHLMENMEMVMALETNPSYAGLAFFLANVKS